MLPAVSAGSEIKRQQSGCSKGTLPLLAKDVRRPVWGRVACVEFCFGGTADHRGRFLLGAPPDQSFAAFDPRHELQVMDQIFTSWAFAALVWGAP